MGQSILSVEIKRESVVISSEIYDAYFDGVEAVALLVRNECLWILPIRVASAGGHILKRTNARGDRVVHAASLLRLHGIEGELHGKLAASWNPQEMALIVALPCHRDADHSFPDEVQT